MSGPSWHRTFRVGRFQVGWHIYRHMGTLPDRWVFQPFLILDRKRKRAAGGDA